MSTLTRSMKAKAYVQVIIQQENYLKNLIKEFTMSAWNAYDSSTMQMNDWARNQSRRFYYEVNKDVKFAEIYNMLMSFGKGMTVEKMSINAMPDNLRADSALMGVILPDSVMTDSEERMGRAKLNSVLYREYSAWWDAFVEEVKEDMEEDASSASDRFSYHCAGILSRKTGLSQDVIAPVVAAWLLEKTVAV